MRNSINALIRTLILLVCSVVQMVEIVVRGIGEMLVRFGELLKTTSDRLMRCLDRGTYEATTEPAIEVE